MNWSPLDTWIVVAGIFSAVACALLGNFLMLRRMSMMGDAISHAVLPGLAVAFLLSGSRASGFMFVGAVVAGLLTALFTQWISRFGKVDEGAAMGVVFTAFFAVGLIIIVRAADAVDLDPGCVLYGAIELVPLDTVDVAGFFVPRAVLTAGVVMLVNLAFVLLFYKELKITSFDPDLSTSLGISAGVMHYALMVLVAVTTVACFETVGSILVIAMLIVPAATAHLLTDRLRPMILCGALLAAASAACGHVAAIVVPAWWGLPDTTTAGSMAVVAGLLLSAAILFAPRHGIVSKMVTRSALQLRIIREDILGMLFRLEEYNVASAPALERDFLRRALGLGGAMRVAAVTGLQRAGDVVRREGRLQLTERGRLKARDVIRSHRLWESYLVKYLGLRVDHVHATSEKLEHVTTRQMQEQLAARTEFPERDPHGHDIPPR